MTASPAPAPPSPKLLRVILTWLAEELSDAELGRMIGTDGRNIRRWRDGIHTPRNIQPIFYVCLGIAHEHGLIPTPPETHTGNE